VLGSINKCLKLICKGIIPGGLEGFEAITVTTEQKHEGSTHFEVSSLFIFRKYSVKTCRKSPWLAIFYCNDFSYNSGTYTVIIFCMKSIV
jgi:hypothetical protein